MEMTDLRRLAYDSLNDLCRLLYNVTLKAQNNSRQMRELMEALELLDNRAKGMLQLVASWGPLNAFVFYFSKAVSSLTNAAAEQLGRFVKCRNVDYVKVCDLLRMNKTDLSYLLYSIMLLMIYNNLVDSFDDNLIGQMDKIINMYLEDKEAPIGEKELLYVLEFLARMVEVKLLPIVNERALEKKVKALLDLCR